MVRFLWHAAAFLLGAATLTACGSSSLDAPATAVAVSTPTSVPGATHRAASLADLSPCGLLTQQYARTLGYTAMSAGQGECNYTSASSAAALFIVFPTVGLGQLRVNGPTELTAPTFVGERPAVMKTFGEQPTCTLGMHVTVDRRVDVQVSGQATIYDACTQAARVAQDIEWQLPAPTW